MATTQINGGTQIRSGTITTTQLSSSAGVTDGQLATAYIKADGTRAFTGNPNGGGFEATNFATPTTSGSLATKGYVDGVAQGLQAKYSARAATVGTETFTIASGSVTQIAGTTLDGQSPSVGEYILIKDAPASTGTGSANSTQPGNGLYQVTGNTTNLSVSRASDMSGSNAPVGSYVFVESGTTYAGSGWIVTTPSSSAAFTYGTGNIAWTQFSGAGEITVDSTLTKTGNQIVRAAITGDVSIPSNSNAATIQAAAVSLSKMANLAANSVIGNTTGSAATPSAVPLAAGATASSVALRDANANLTVNGLIEASQTVATAAGTTTLTVSSPQLTQFTGSTTQTCVLPNATTLANGQKFTITNRSTGVVTVQTNGGATLQTMAAGSQLLATVISNGTSAGTWDVAYSVASSSGLTAPAAGLVKSNGSVLQTATAGTDYMAPSDFVTRETPSGTVNGSTTAFTLANTPIAGTECVFLNGVLQEPGAGNDYTISGATITYLTAPITGDRIRVNYQK